MKRKKMYISVPITGRVIEDAKMQAEQVKRMWSEDYDVITPFEIHEEVEDEEKPYSYYMGKDVEVLLECDAIYMCSGWVDSKGCNLEYSIAKIYGIRIIG